MRRVLEIRTGHPRRKFVAAALFCLLTAGGIWWWSQDHYAAELARLAEQEQQLRDLRREQQGLEETERAQGEEILQLRHQLAVLDRKRQVDQEWLGKWQRELHQCFAENHKIRHEIDFYEQAMGAADAASAPTVQSLLLEQLDTQRHYRYRFILTHWAKSNKEQQGKLQISVLGMAPDGAKKSLDIRDVRIGDPSDLDVRFKSFRQIQGNLMLPEDFESVSMVIRLQVGSQAAERVFDWLDSLNPYASQG